MHGKKYHYGFLDAEAPTSRGNVPLHFKQYNILLKGGLGLYHSWRTTHRENGQFW